MRFLCQTTGQVCHGVRRSLASTLVLAAMAAPLSQAAVVEEAKVESVKVEPVNSALEEIVITASRSQQRVFDSPASLTVIGEEELSRSTAYGLADMLRDVPGLQVTDAGQPGLKRIRIAVKNLVVLRSW